MKTRKLVITALFAALTCVATMVIRIPSGVSGGYVNLGDGMVLISAYILGPVFGALAAGIGSCLADVFAGYASFAIPTLVIKFLMALAAGFVFKRMNKSKKWYVLVLCSVLGEVIMVVGYFLVEIWLSGSLTAAATGIYGNLTQAVFGVVVSAVLYKGLTVNSTLKRYIDKM